MPFHSNDATWRALSNCHTSPTPKVGILVQHHCQRNITKEILGCVQAVLDIAEDVFGEDDLVGATHRFTEFIFGAYDSAVLTFAVRCGLIQRFISFLSRDSNPELQCEAARVLEAIAAISSELRDHILSHGAIDMLLRLSSQTQSWRLRKHVANALGWLFRGQPPPDLKLVSPALPTLARFYAVEGREIIDNVGHALADFVGESDDHREAALQVGILSRAVQLMTSPASVFVRQPAYEIVAHFCKGNIKHKQAAIDCGALFGIRESLASSHASVIMTRMSAVSNILAGTQQQLQSVIDCGIFKDLVVLMGHLRSDIQIRAAQPVATAIKSASREQIQQMMDLGCIDALCQFFFSSRRVDSQRIALEGLQSFLEFGAQAGNGSANPVARLMTQYASLERWNQQLEGVSSTNLQGLNSVLKVPRDGSS